MRKVLFKMNRMPKIIQTVIRWKIQKILYPVKEKEISQTENPQEKASTDTPEEHFLTEDRFSTGENVKWSDILENAAFSYETDDKAKPVTEKKLEPKDEYESLNPNVPKIDGYYEWHSNPEINCVGVLPARSSFFSYSSKKAALTFNPDKSRRISLNGQWRFRRFSKLFSFEAMCGICPSVL